MRKLLIVVITALCMVTVACAPLAQQARDTAAALNGALTAARTSNDTTCRVNPATTVCQSILRGVAAQNALITATESYCGFAISPTPPPPDAQCSPVKSAETALKVAIANANQIIGELKGTVKP